jgi:hypothetical protein
MSPGEDGNVDGAEDPTGREEPDRIVGVPGVQERPASGEQQAGPDRKRKRRRLLAGGAGGAIVIAVAIRLVVGAGLFAAQTATQPGGALNRTIIRDDFSKPDDRWSVVQNAEVTAGFADGAYRILVVPANAEDIFTSYYKGIDWNAVRVEADGKKAELNAPEGAYGVACVSGDSYYTFVVNPDGFEWGIFKGSTPEGSQDQNLSMGSNPSISGADGTNHFRVQCSYGSNGQTTLVFSVNGTQLTRYVDANGLSHFTGMGLLASTFDKGGFDARFDNAIMTRV